MRYYAATDTPIEIRGLFTKGENGDYFRLPADRVDSFGEKIGILGRRNTGGRLRFRTDSPIVTVETGLKTLTVDICIGLPGSAGADIYLGMGADARYAGFAAPKEYSTRAGSATVSKAPVMEQVTVDLPRNERLAYAKIGVEDGAALEAPEPFAYSLPVVFYGSSITEGGCASRPGLAYTAIACRRLNADFYNFGFSGGALGEESMARFLAGIPMSAFVMDYDHNAPNPEHLAATHGPFFRIVREAQPELPVILMSRPDFDKNLPDSRARRSAVLATYEKALVAGDRRVYFIDGQTLFGDTDRSDCTVDGCHPNDIGFLRMADVVTPVLRKALSAR